MTELMPNVPGPKSARPVDVQVQPLRFDDAEVEERRVDLLAVARARIPANHSAEQLLMSYVGFVCPFQLKQLL